ncbi:two component transcriptional regulator, winged helix family [Coriobacterium glomerans PW2]|uniref:Two component transcriptional regulator, winged helix family n=1 Tax=Coriobacterium glomerans (strain ATCC 49209 / DSM 20642 / JCM 10262 / PW2) TaxID=700015 RepID=F2N9T9_CORGP|nr:response regulator transcription factor [Coriobacterium glomerans]AEB07192.1 two component transcriptional regulator, winged helix family [Coriobacterium glomerans PW2]
MKHRILLVEDDPIIVSSLSELLVSEGYGVEHAATQNAAIERVHVLSDSSLGARCEQRVGAPLSLVLLDVTLEEGNGFAVCGEIKREQPDLPVIFLTASDDEFNTVTGLTMGADDYIAKPFRPRELIARIATAIRRAQPNARKVFFGPLAIDTERAHVERDGCELILSALEYRLLLLFATNPGRLVTREMIREALWDDAGAYIEENTLSVYIKRLRDRIEDDPAHPKMITTVRGMGYKASVA